MLIKEINAPKASSVQFHFANRCTKEVKSTGTGYFNNDKEHCSRVARFNIDGVELCTQHAGDLALKYLIKQQQSTGIKNDNS